MKIFWKKSRTVLQKQEGGPFGVENLMVNGTVEKQNEPTFLLNIEYFEKIHSVEKEPTYIA